jgi:acetyltransferase-like isoleucine patch superfamily enzyme
MWGNRDPRQARFLTRASLRWVVRNRAWTPWYLIRYWRFFLFRLRHRTVVTEGFVFLGKRVSVEVRAGYGRMIIGRWVHIGDDNRLRCHEGTFRIGDKVVMGRDNTINCYLDVHIGASVLMSDSIYICDFDHRHEALDVSIKDQGIVKTPVYIDRDVWIGVRSIILRGSRIGAGGVVGAGAVVRGDFPPESVIAGVPARVVRSRREVAQLRARQRAEREALRARTSERDSAGIPTP